MSNQQRPPLSRGVISASATDKHVVVVAQDGTLWRYVFVLGRWQQIPVLPDTNEGVPENGS